MQCYLCTHYVKETSDSMSGPGEPAECTAFDEIADSVEDGKAADLLIGYFTVLAERLSILNNCPFYTVPRRSINLLRPKQDQNGQ